MRTSQQIVTDWEQWDGPLYTFARSLDEQGEKYLSFSRISAVEFCPQRYLLQYVQGVRPEVEPRYFVRGRLFHQAAATLHLARQQGRWISLDQLVEPLEKELDPREMHHVRGGLACMQQQVEEDWRVVGVEEPFVLDLAPGLPPCLGIIDLVLRKDDRYAVVDHKCCGRFYTPDPLQLQIYAQYVRRRYGATDVLACFDQYSVADSAADEQAEAFRRTSVDVNTHAWAATQKRIAKAHRRISDIERTGVAAASGNCNACFMQSVCESQDDDK